MQPNKYQLLTRLSSFAACAALAASMSLTLGACGDSPDEPGIEDPDLPDPDAAYNVTGTVLDLQTGLPVEGNVSLSIDNVSPAPIVTTNGSTFTLDKVPANSTFHVLASSAPDHRSTYNVAVEVGDANVEDVELFVVREAYLAEMVAAFELTPAFGTGIIIARALDENGNAYEGLPADQFKLPDNVVGPYFLDAEMAPDKNLTATSASGFVVIFDVPPGLTSVTSIDGANYGIAMANSPVSASSVTYATLSVTDGGVEPLPTNVSFSGDISPIFMMRGCDNCHDGGGPGKDLGGLHLNGADEKMYKEVATETSSIYQILRVNIESPAESLMLTMPSAEDPPDRHPFSTFTGPDDPDYLTILAWIQEGALDN